MMRRYLSDSVPSDLVARATGRRHRWVTALVFRIGRLIRSRGNATMRQPGRHQGNTRFRSARRTLLTVGTVAAASAALLVPSADATTSVSGGDVGTSPPVIRGTSTTITSDSGALMYYRSGTAT